MRAGAAFAVTEQRDFLVCATPGAGKTRFALDVAARQRELGVVARVAVTVPTDALRQQWVTVARDSGLDLLPGECGKGDGCVMTYAQLATAADRLRASMAVPTLAIMDEIHHAGTDRSWGIALRRAMEPAVRRLELTGTPWRRDANSAIPFVRYGPDGVVMVDASYEYADAVADGVCRQVRFHPYRGANRALLQQADQALSELRLRIPDAGGLVVAQGQQAARDYARLLTTITGERTAVAVSDDRDAKANIEAFRDGVSRWLVSVKMVSEGVDIPRLLVGVFAARTRTPLFFRQVIGRFVRVRPGETATAVVFIPTALLAHAREFDDQLRHQLDGPHDPLADLKAVLRRVIRQLDTLAQN